MFDFEHQLKILPDSPGVYIMKDARGEIIYIGKAKILKNRVRQYFRNSQRLDTKTRLMVSHVAEFEYIVTDSEIESLILEQNLIKEHLPKYNINLKDDKRFPFIKITLKEDFPRVFMTRQTPKDGSRYFGPFTDVNSVYETLESIKAIYPIRTCSRTILEGGPYTRPCLNYHMGLCKAPCAGYISKAEYGAMIEEIMELLNGGDPGMKKQLKRDMEAAAEALDFERAARLRDQYLAIDKVQKKQKIYFAQKESDEDYVALFQDETDTCIQVFFQRDGKIQGREHFIVTDTLDQSPESLMGEFLESFYGKTAYIPRIIYSQEVEEPELIEQFLTLKKGNQVRLEVPRRGDKKRLVELVRRNAEVTLSAFKGKILKETALGEEALESLAALLELEEFPHRIESFDISNIAGVDSVGSMVVFEEGKPKSSDYRRFKIKTVQGPNDYDSLREIMVRRFQRGLEEIQRMKDSELEIRQGKFSFFPDLILMDGGKGQVSLAEDVLRGLNLEIPVAGLVKDDRHRTRGLIYRNQEINLSGYSNVLHFITRIQDEVHRFAITYHRSLRKRTQIRSVLDDIPGIGERRRKNLLLKFGSIEAIRAASLEELQSVPAMDKRAALAVRSFFDPPIPEGDSSQRLTDPAESPENPAGPDRDLPKNETDRIVPEAEPEAINWEQSESGAQRPDPET